MLFPSFLDSFPKWIGPLFIFFSLMAIGFMIFQLRYFPFQHFVMNGVYAGLLVAMGINEIFVGIRYYGVSLSSTSMFPIAICVGVITSVISLLLLNKRRNRMVSAMNPEGVSDNAQQKSYLEGLRFPSETEIFAYLRVGLARRCNLFLDFSLMHYIADTYSSQSLLLATAQMLAFFPTEVQFSGSCLAMIQGGDQLSIWDRFLLDQTGKVFLIRQSSLSKEAEDARGTIRHLWVEITKSTGLFNLHAFRSCENLAIEFVVALLI
jgi:hypothetical protein